MNAGIEEYQHWQQFGGLFDLSAHAKLRLTGADRVRYLNGQVTANITKLRLGDTLPACVTTAKGKLSAVVVITAQEEALLLDAEPVVRESLSARLERYIVADDVVVEDVTEQCGLLHFVGSEEAGRAFAAGVLPALVRRANRFGALGWEALLEPVALAQVLERYAAEDGPRLLSRELTETIRLEAGLPKWGAELGEETLPPEAGLDRTHIDYAKGCYIGQEVISRLKSVGHVNRELRAFVSSSGAELQPGWPLFAPGNATKPLGVLTSAGWSFALAKPVALGYLRRQAPAGVLLAQPADLSLGSVEVTTVELPLAVPFAQS